MRHILERFLSFETLLGPLLVKIVYFSLAAAILFSVGATMISGMLSLFAGNIGGGLTQLLAAPAVGAVALVYWRFLCELFMIAFLAYERLGEVRDKLTHTQF